MKEKRIHYGYTDILDKTSLEEKIDYLITGNNLQIRLLEYIKETKHEIGYDIKEKNQDNYGEIVIDNHPFYLCRHNKRPNLLIFSCFDRPAVLQLISPMKNIENFDEYFDLLRKMDHSFNQALIEIYKKAKTDLSSKKIKVLTAEHNFKGSIRSQEKEKGLCFCINEEDLNAFFIQNHDLYGVFTTNKSEAKNEEIEIKFSVSFDPKTFTFEHGDITYGVYDRYSR